MVVYKVQALDEFGRKFGNQYAVPDGAIKDMRFRSDRFMFQKLVKEILIQMGEAARADWVGETVHYDF